MQKAMQSSAGSAVIPTLNGINTNTVCLKILVKFQKAQLF